jgi:hypothetical protein
MFVYLVFKATRRRENFPVRPADGETLLRPSPLPPARPLIYPLPSVSDTTGSYHGAKDAALLY